MKAGIIRQIASNDTLNETIDEILQSDNAMSQAIIKGQEIAQEACMRPSKAAHCIITTIEK